MIKPPVFVTTNASYDSYTDFWKLVHASGFETCHQDNIDSSRNVSYIISPTNGDIEAMLDSRKGTRECSFILWFLERPGNPPHESFAQEIAARIERYQLDQIWFSDRAMQGLVSHVEGTKFVPMGSDEAIGTPSKNQFEFDLTHMSYVWGRRSFLDYSPHTVGKNCWGDERHHTLRSSKFMVNVHQDDGQYHEPLRFALCAAYAIPMFTEHCIDPFPYEPGKDIIMAPYSELEDKITSMLTDDYNKYQPIGSQMWETATKKYRFRNNVEAAL